MKVQDFNYTLPQELIAQTPAPERDQSRLLVLDRASGRITHTRFRNLPEFLMPADTVVLNDTKVIPARLTGKRITGGRVILLLIHEVSPGRWTTLVDSARRLKPGEEILFDHNGSCRLIERTAEGPWLAEFSQDPRSLMRAIGHPPLPPYIRRKEGLHADDAERYQTVYAEKEGSIAAPTAGLHFTPQVMAALLDKGVSIVRITLHIGLGTFKPIQCDDTEDHRMDEEAYTIPAGTAESLRQTRQRGGRIVAVGTSACRTLESSRELTRLFGTTQLFIRPPHSFQMVDAMITNFHLPRGTPLILVSALAGRDLILKTYEEAIREKYRFYSYGDAMLIL